MTANDKPLPMSPPRSPVASTHSRKRRNSSQLCIMNPTPPPDTPSRHPSQSSQTSDSHGQYAPLAMSPVGMGPTPPYSHSPPPGHPFMVQPPMPPHPPNAPHQSPPHQSSQPPQQQTPPQQAQLQHTPLQYQPAPSAAPLPISLTGGGRVAARVMQRAVSASQYADAHAQQHTVQAHSQAPQALQLLHPLHPPQPSQPQPAPPQESRRLTMQLTGPRGRPSLPTLPQGQQAPPPLMPSLPSQPVSTRAQHEPQPQAQVPPTIESHAQPDTPAPAPPPTPPSPPASQQPPQLSQDSPTPPPAPHTPQPHPPQPHFVPRPPSALYAQRNIPQNPQAVHPPLPEGADPGGPPPPPHLARPSFAPQMPSALYAQGAAPRTPSQEYQPPSPPKPYPYPMSPGAREPLLEEADVDLPGVTLHPDFAREGDVVLVCNERDTKIGFMVHRAALARVSPVFAAALRTLEPARLPTLALLDSAADMALLLSALVHGAVGAPRAQGPPPTVAEYLALHRLYAKYAVRPFLLAMLRHRIAERGYELAAPLANPRSARGEIAAYLRLAAACRSPRLWDCALKYARTWQYFVAPWRMDEHEIAGVGEDAYGVLLALEALKNASGENAWTDLRVLYNGAGKPGVARARDDTVFWIEDAVSGSGGMQGTEAVPN